MEEPVISKKRILTGANGSPHVNGDVEQDDEAFGEKLELFRKEAIYRRMKHYSKENERSQARIEELEQRKSTCEAGLAAISACWAQLVDTIRLIVKPEDLPQVSLRAEEIFDLTAQLQDNPVPELAVALGETVNATQALVTRFVQLEQGKLSRRLQSDGFPECQKAQNECILLRSELSVLRERLKESESQKEAYHSSLVALENRIERSKSATVRATESRESHDGVKGHEVGNEKKDEAQRKPPSPVPSPAPRPLIQENGVHDSSETDVLLEQIKVRDAKIQELEHEAALLRDEKTMMDVEHKAPSFEQISENPYYKVILDHASLLTSQLAEKSDQMYKLQMELGDLQTTRNEWEETVAASSAQSVQEYKNMLMRRDVDNARLREQREQLTAELNERKQKEAVKQASFQEYKSLVDSSSERIHILQSELSRCKAQLAANASAEDLMIFYLGGNIDEVRFFEGLREQKQLAENRVAALEQTFSIYQDDHPDIVQHMKAQANALEELARAKFELERYQRIYGPSAPLSADISGLKKQLEDKEAECQRLRHLETQQKENEGSIFSELEKLSTLWESLDRQLKSKVYDLSNLEERLMKAGIDKAKSDNKYFAAMRDKEAIEIERKNLTRTLEKQGKVVDRLTDAEKHLRTQLAALEKENVALKKLIDQLKTKLSHMEKELPETNAHLETEKKRYQELQCQLRDREAFLSSKMSEFRQKEDEFIHAKKDLEKEMAQLRKRRKLEPNSKLSDAESDKLANLEALINCSTCREDNAFRSTIITKCMHTFCKSCVDARLATRQRKCPACNLAFGQSDVHQFYFQ
ncbi:BRE1-domain-containing protein [Pholiota conissans]|uniref:E3 ubiquitin protein ligase n=1 Tax=Pholiota conissans TaxID=109636 RepID=A0A9P5Z700_9AGAR|nr:BRE1-domain-containing protein [Pholiota conissans]